MKKIFATLMVMAMMAVTIPSLAGTASAQTRYRSSRTSTTVYRRPSFYRRHRNMINMAIGAGSGALVGGLIGGRRGVGLGLLGGLGAGALYTYKLNPKVRRY